MKPQPHNVEAIRQWLADLGVSNDNREWFDVLLETEHLNPKAEALLALALQGFEAGRRFQSEYPGVPLGGGVHYLPEHPLPPPVHATALEQAARAAVAAIDEELAAAGPEDVEDHPTLRRHRAVSEALEAVLDKIAAQRR